MTTPLTRRIHSTVHSVPFRNRNNYQVILFPVCVLLDFPCAVSCSGRNVDTRTTRKRSRGCVNGNAQNAANGECDLSCRASSCSGLFRNQNIGSGNVDWPSCGSGPIVGEPLQCALEAADADVGTIFECFDLLSVVKDARAYRREGDTLFFGVRAGD